MSADTVNIGSVKEASERKRVIDHILRYELFRHRDITERLRQLLNVDRAPDAFNRSTWDILYYLIQCHLQNMTPNVTDIYITTGLSKGTAISGLAELERRKAIHKVQDRSDARRRRIGISESVIDELELFIGECAARLGQGYDAPLAAAGQDSAIKSGGAASSGQEPLIDLLNQLSHQLRTPLTAIVGFSEMIADETLGPVQPAGYAEYARDIRHAASHLLDALNNLVDTTLAEYGVNIPLGPVLQYDIEELVDAICREAAPAADRRGVILRRKWSSVKGRISCDQDRLKQCFRRLIEATILSAGRGYTIDIETAFETGKGMTLKLISPTRPSLTTRSDAQRTIGSPEQNSLAQSLPLIRAIVVAHHGTIDFAEEGPRRFVSRIFLPETGPARPV